MARQTTDQLYIELDYFYPEEFYVYTAEAQAVLSCTSTIDCTISNVRGADLVAFSDAALTADAIVTRDVSAAIAATATIDQFVGDLYALRSASLSSEFAQTVDANRLREPQIALNSEFIFDALISISGAVECAGTFTASASLDITPDLFKDMSANFYADAVCDPDGVQRIRGVDSTQQAEFTQSLTFTKIVQAEAAFTSAFSPSMTVEAVKNVFAVLDSSTALAAVANANRSADIVLASIIALSLQGDRKRGYAVSATLQFNLSASAIRIQPSTTNLSSSFTQTTNVVRNRFAQSSLSAVASISATSTKIIRFTSAVSSAFALTTTGRVTKKTNVALSSIATQTAQARATKSGAASLTAFYTEIVVGQPTSRVDMQAVSAISITPRYTAKSSASLSAVSSLSSTIRINAKPPVLFPTRYTGFDVSFQFKFTASSNRVYVETMNAVHDDANILRMASINSNTPEIYSGLPIKLASNISFTNNETKNITLVGGGTGKVAIKSGERFHIKTPNVGWTGRGVVDNNRFFIANADITDATTTVSVTSAPSGGGTFNTNDQIISWYFFPNSPVIMNILGPTALGGTGTSRISLGWWAGSKQTVATPLNRIYGWDYYATGFQNISSANSLNIWHTCRVYADSTTWPNVILQINGSSVTLTPTYQTSLNNYAPYPTTTEANIFGTIDNLEQFTVGSDGLIQNSTVIQNGTYNSYPQEIGVATITPAFSVSVNPSYVKLAQASLSSQFSTNVQYTRFRTPSATQVNSNFTETVRGRVSYDPTIRINTANFQETATPKKIVGITANLNSAFTATTTVRKVNRTTVTLTAQAVVNSTVRKYVGNGASLFPVITTTINNSRTRSFASSIQAMASELAVVVKTGRGIVQLDSRAQQSTVAVKTARIVSAQTSVATQVTDAYKRVRTSAGVTARATLTLIPLKIPRSTVSMESAFTSAITTNNSKTTRFSAGMTSTAQQSTVAVKTARTQKTLSAVATLAFGTQVTRLRLASSQQSAVVTVSAPAVKTARTSSNMQAFDTLLAIGTKISFDPDLQLTVPKEYMTVHVLEENTLLMVPAETRVNMVRMTT